MIRRHSVMTGITVAVGVGTGVLVAATTFREPARPRPEVSTSAAVAVHEDAAWRWLGPAACERVREARTTVERLVAGVWVSAVMPLAQVRQLTVSDGVRGLAVGTDESCRTQFAVTDDGGRTWRRVSAGGAVLSASRRGSHVWSVMRRAAGRHELTVRPAPGAVPEIVRVPCRDDDGVASLVEAVDQQSAWVVCQLPRTFVRLLLGTRDGGRTWSRKADGRIGGGFDGLGTVLATWMGSGPRGWAVLTTEHCAEGDLRMSPDNGRTWTPLVCLGEELGLRRLLSMQMTSTGRGVLVGLKAGNAVTLLTRDGGRTWRPA
ncbi:MAG TPA: hypothetical protein VNB94_02140 [Mycobacteriales bacterium]|nr:hypothetical protein [Mycobacteriales bacterium]